MNDNLNGNTGNSSSPSSDITQNEANTVGGAFTRQFYTTLSSSIQVIQKFYSNESSLQYDGKFGTGQAEIGQVYEKNTPSQVRLKIHQTRALPTLHQGIMLQVIGVLNFRPFVQTFLLGQQCPKKYYVENDSFEYLDQLITECKETKVPNGHSTNGKIEEPVAAPAVVEPTFVSKPIQEVQVTPKKKEVVKSVPRTPEKPIEKTPEPVKVQTPVSKIAPQPAPVAEVIPQDPPKPKTWAHLVGSGLKPTSVPPQQHQQQQIPLSASPHKTQSQQPAQNHQTQQVPRDTHPQTQNADRNETGALSERKIFLGGIVRSFVPDSTATAESEIRTIFYQYGEVEEVFMPKKSLDFPNDTSKYAFAFITMRSVAAAQKVFENAVKDSQGNWQLKLKLDAFGFDGMANISEHKERSMQGGFRGRGGPGAFQRSGFPPRGRGGPQNGNRGGMRGGFHNNHINGN